MLLLFSPPAEAADATPKPPVADKRPHSIVAPSGETRIDNYFWLRDDSRKSPEVLNFIAAQNRYADAVLAPIKPLEDKIYAELSGRVPPTEDSVAYQKGGYWYYTRFEPGKDYPIVARRKGSMQAPEEVLLDEPTMATGSAYFDVKYFAVSPDGRRIAWTEDRVGRLQYKLQVKDIASGRVLTDTVSNVAQDFAWADDNTLVYIDKDPVTLLNKTVKTHTIGAPAPDDKTIYEAPDTSFYITVRRTADDKYLCIDEHSFVSNEGHCARTQGPLAFDLIAPREQGIHYDEDHIGDHWVIRTDWNAPNYKLMTVSDTQVSKGRAAWTDLVPTDRDTFIETFKPFDQFVAIEERRGDNKIIRLRMNDGSTRDVTADEPAYVMALGSNEDPSSPWLRYTYTSFRTPLTTFDINAQTGERRLLHTQLVPGYDKNLYVTERVWAPARDGARVPVTLFYRKGFRRDGKAAMLQYAYGSYGAVFDPVFQSYTVSLADRGMVFAVAGVRGGGDLGRAWYDAGHALNKQNTFNDFIDVTHYLVAQHYAAPDRVGAYGSSAGGLLMGGIANMAPQDYRVIVAHAPYVDAVTTMLDPTIPLVTNEYTEWGNPARKRDYDYMLSYSPYDNVKPRAYPAMFIATSLWDSQVQYYEPTKWAAKLQANNQDDHTILLRTDLAANHGGRSGRFGKAGEQSEFLAFVLDQLGVHH
jgi:oligopeptidase B